MPPSTLEHDTPQAVRYGEGTAEYRILNQSLDLPSVRVRRAGAHQPTTIEWFKRAIEKSGKKVPTVDSRSQFHYSSLGTGEIRLLLLYPSKHPEDPLKADLFKRKLVDVEGRYEALSYCWGTGAADYEIQIRDLNAASPVVRPKKQSPPGRDKNPSDDAWEPVRVAVGAITHTGFKIRQNLYDALKRLRRKYGEVCLWVDAICIDQSAQGAHEKEVQLAMMARIYNMAASVCVWLGEDHGGGAKMAFQLARDIMNYRNFDDMYHDPQKKAAWGHLATVMRAEWFSRRWVIQEIAHSREATIHCGEHSLHWDDFADAVSLLVEKIDLMRVGYTDEVFDDVETTSASILIQTLANILRKSDSEEDRGRVYGYLLDLETLLSTLLAFQATYPMDTVYSVLSLARDFPEPNEAWAAMHAEQTKKVRDEKMKCLSGALEKERAKKKRLERDIENGKGLRKKVDEGIQNVEELRQQLVDAWVHDKENEAQELESHLRQMGEGGLQILYDYFKGLEGSLRQCRGKIRNLESQLESASSEIQTVPVSLLPNYKFSPRDLFIAFVTRAIWQTGHLDIICRHWAPELTKPEDGAGLLPSWISGRSRSAFGLPGTARGKQNGENFVAYLPHDQRRRYAASGQSVVEIRMILDPNLTDIESIAAQTEVPVVKTIAPAGNATSDEETIKQPALGSQSNGEGARATHGTQKETELRPSREPRPAPEEHTGQGVVPGSFPEREESLRGKSPYPGSEKSKSWPWNRSFWSGRSDRRKSDPARNPSVEPEPQENGDHDARPPHPSQGAEGEMGGREDENANREHDESPGPENKSQSPSPLPAPAPATDKPDGKEIASEAPPSFATRFPGPHRLSGIMGVKGFVLGKIQSQSDVMRGGVISGAWVSKLGWRKNEENQVPEVLWRLLVADRSDQGVRPPLWYKRACLHGLVDGRVSDNAGNIHPVTPKDRRISELTAKYFDRVESVVWNRRIFELVPHSRAGQAAPSGDGKESEQAMSGQAAQAGPPKGQSLFGLGPEESEAGHIVCILYGCSVPVVLREAKVQRLPGLLLHEVVGEAYVDGAMDGEFMIKEWTDKGDEFFLT